MKSLGKEENKEFVHQVYQKIGRERFEIISSLLMKQASDWDQLHLHGFSELVDGSFKFNFTDFQDYLDKSSPRLKLKDSSLSRL